jgi:hypothetical protein
MYIRGCIPWVANLMLPSRGWLYTPSSIPRVGCVYCTGCTPAGGPYYGLIAYQRCILKVAYQGLFKCFMVSYQMFHTNGWLYCIPGVALHTRGWLVTQGCMVWLHSGLHTSARIYRPSFCENKPKTLVFSHTKRAFWACL